MSRFDLTPIAENDLIEIIRYIAEDSPDSAIRVKNQLQAAFSRLAMAPGMERAIWKRFLLACRDELSQATCQI
ncbi:MAG TPA: type II toxin-antitoxin system RelE/ParE family toxin [Tepidisphaeraceae bacterium]|nr:type II toxin-antitoxin system RelE/ParE family toxin [Tepidisphaeraceae bacterium]